VTFNTERCFVVRGLDTIAGVDVEGPASDAGCVTPRDTFPPPAPTALEAVAGARVISLIWEAVEAPDLAGYLVYRGEAGGDPATPLTSAPMTATSFEDRTVTPGVRYVYVVVAIDSATPANRSAPSNRAEDVARQ
jgi:fibronectin type 3 domain-containing protein